MNFTYIPPLKPLKVVVNDPLTTGTRTLVFKIMAGRVFGARQPINLILLIYDNEKAAAETFKNDLLECAFFCTASIHISSDLSRIRGVDIFCITTKFQNPNWIDFADTGNDAMFHTTYFLLKVANFMNNNMLLEEPLPEEERKWSLDKYRKPIVITDGLVSLDILASYASKVPNDVFYCPTPLPNLARAALAKYLKVSCDDLNYFKTWAGSDRKFYFEIEKPMLRTDLLNMKGQKCNWSLMSHQMMSELKLDPTKISSSYIKKELHTQVHQLATANSYTDLYRATTMAETLKFLWSTRTCKDKELRHPYSVGVVSDGSFDTLKRMPYVLPVMLNGDTWSADERIDDIHHMEYEVKEMNKATRQRHKYLMAYCKRF